MRIQIRKVIQITIIIGILMLSSGCSHSLTDTSIQPLSRNNPVVSASPLGYTNNISESGLFYFKNQTMRYLNYDVNTSFILCSQVNCRHSDQKCNAWYNGLYGAYGLAQFGENIYVFKYNDSEHTYDLLEMDLTAGNNKTICSIEAGDYSPGTWAIISFSNYASYAGHYVWLEATYQYCEDLTVLETNYNPIMDTTIIEIDLDNGRTTTLYELSNDNKVERSIKLVSNDFIVIEEVWDAEPLKSEDEFSEILSDGLYPEFEDSTDPYYSYMIWHEQNKTVMFSYLAYDIGTSDTTIITSGELTSCYDEEGVVYWRDSGYRFLGTWGGSMVYSVNTHLDMPEYKMNDWEVYSYDYKTDTRQFIIKLSGGNILTMDTGGITRDGSILYGLYTRNETIIIYRYSIAADMTVELFEDVWNITFRIQGETSDSFVGSMIRDHDDSVLYKLSKEDFYAGRFSSAVRLDK